MKIKQLVISCVLISVLVPVTATAYIGYNYEYLNSSFPLCITTARATSTTEISNGMRYVFFKSTLSKATDCDRFINLYMKSISSISLCKCNSGYYSYKSTQDSDTCSCNKCVTYGNTNTADAYNKMQSCGSSGITCYSGNALKFGELPVGSQRPDFYGDYCASCPPNAQRCDNYTLAINTCPKNYFYYASANVCTTCPNNGLTDDPDASGAAHPRPMTDCYIAADNLSDTTGKYTCGSNSNNRIYWEN